MSKKDFRFGISGDVRGVDLNHLLITNAQSSFFMRIADDLPELGLLDDDIVLVDRSLKPRRKDLVVIAMQADPELQIARFEHVHEDAELWGVVVHLIRKLRA